MATARLAPARPKRLLLAQSLARLKPSRQHFVFGLELRAALLQFHRVLVPAGLIHQGIPRMRNPQKNQELFAYASAAAASAARVVALLVVLLFSEVDST